MPALENPISEFLAADPNDSEALGGFKDALEGLGLGALTEGEIRRVREVRIGRNVKAAQPEPTATAVEANAFENLDAPRISTDAGSIEINFNQINGSDDVKLVMQEPADSKLADIDKARRGT